MPRLDRAVADVAATPEEGRMRMTWTFTPRGGTTRVAIDATDVPPGIDADAHQQGLEASLAQLAAYLAPEA